MTKRFIALARVSSREQEREGFSLDVQEQAFHQYAKSKDGEIVRLFRIAETATKADQRRVFKEVVQYAKKHASELDAVLFYKIDRAARNLKDYVVLEDLENDHHIEFVSVTQPIQNTPTGRMMRRTLATMAAFITEQQSLDVREGIRQRVLNGLPPSRPPYGYRNVRHEGRSVVEVHPENSQKVRRIFRLYAFVGMSVKQIVEQLFNEGIYYAPSKPKFSISKIYGILRDRTYVGEVKHQGKWHPGKHDSLVDFETWDRTQLLSGQKVYRSHQMVYADQLIACGFCGRPISGESKEKTTKCGIQRYTYYRCSRYQASSHPRIRIKEEDFDKQLLELFNCMHANSEQIKDWLVAVFRATAKNVRCVEGQKIEETKRQLSLVVKQQDELLEIRLAGRITDERFMAKEEELRDRERRLRQLLDIPISTQGGDSTAEAKAAEVFRTIKEAWPLTPDLVKRRIVHILFAGFTLDGEQLVASSRTPFELLIAD